ncbi:MAG: hypothetical protein HGB05_21760 [Chloroflexi bacterium]|nr:hypothetical protein [Chloroflexota bacterium]
MNVELASATAVSVTREPWQYSQRAVNVVREYTRLRYSLIPYLLAYASESAREGLPMLRPMV